MAEISIIKYSEKAGVVIGDTRAVKDKLKALRCSWNAKLTINGERACGWIFPLSQLAAVESTLGISMRAPTASSAPAPAAAAEAAKEEGAAFSSSTVSSSSSAAAAAGEEGTAPSAAAAAAAAAAASSSSSSSAAAAITTYTAPSGAFLLVGPTFAHKEALKAAGGQWVSGWRFDSAQEAAVQAILSAPPPAPAAGHGAKRKREDSASSSSSSSSSSNSSGGSNAALAWMVRCQMEAAEASAGTSLITRPQACACCGVQRPAGSRPFFASSSTTPNSRTFLVPCSLRFAVPGAAAGAAAAAAAAAPLSAKEAGKERKALLASDDHYEDMDCGLGGMGLESSFVGVELVAKRQAREKKDWDRGVGHCCKMLCAECMDAPHQCASHMLEVPE